MRKQKLFSICLGNERLKTEVVLVGWKSGFFFLVVEGRKWNNLEIREPNLARLFVCSIGFSAAIGGWLLMKKTERYNCYL